MRTQIRDFRVDDAAVQVAEVGKNPWISTWHVLRGHLHQVLHKYSM